MIQMKHAYTEDGYCRVHYKYKNSQDAWVMYCLMEDRDNIVKMYRCSPEGEPDYVVVPHKADLSLEIPPDEYGKELYHRYFKGAV